MNNKIIISEIKNRIFGFEFIDDKLERIINIDNNSLVGNIYCGYVKDIVDNINVAFVEFGDNELGFLPLKGVNKDLKQGDKILVSVSGDKIKTKDYLLTHKVSFSGSLCVLTAFDTGINISRKIADADKRNTLRNYMLKYKSDEYGFIIRTNAKEKSIDQVGIEAAKLINIYNKCKRKFEHIKPKSLIYENNRVLNTCRNFIEKYNGEIITDLEHIYEKLKKENINVVFNGDTKVNLVNKYCLDKHIKNAISTKVWLKSGAYLVIEPTEAMTVIDVNTGKAEFKADREETFFKINLEAAREIIRQLKIRNISGIIIIDFINMNDKKNYVCLKEEINKHIMNDYVPCTALDFTKLGLLEMTRKKQEKPLLEILKEEEK